MACLFKLETDSKMHLNEIEHVSLWKFFFFLMCFTFTVLQLSNLKHLIQLKVVFYWINFQVELRQKSPTGDTSLTQHCTSWAASASLSPHQSLYSTDMKNLTCWTLQKLTLMSTMHHNITIVKYLWNAACDRLTFSAHNCCVNKGSNAIVSLWEVF